MGPLRIVVCFAIPAIGVFAQPSNAEEINPADPTDGTFTVLGEDFSALREAFSRDADRWRVVLLVSPTCSECVLGARAVVTGILHRYPADRLDAEVVWIPMLPTDSEAEARRAAAMFKGLKAHHYYDGAQAVGWAYHRGPFDGMAKRARRSLPEGHWLIEEWAKHREDTPQWDLYMLYAPGVRWATHPPEPTAWIRHLGRIGEGERSLFWRDSPDLHPREEDLMGAMRQMAEETIGMPTRATEKSGPDLPMRIEIVSFEGCPNGEKSLLNVRSALDSMGLKAEVVLVDQNSLSPADPRRAWASPTILVNGADLFGLPQPRASQDACRIYGDGAGAPTVEMIAAELGAHE